MSTAEVSPGDRPLSGVRRYWSSFLKFAGAELEDYSASFTFDWPVFLFWSLVVAAVVVAALHSIELFLFRATSNRTLESLALTPSIALAVALIGLLVWAYWRIRVDTTKEHPYIVAVLAFVLAIGVGVEAFAGITTVHLEGNSSSPSLWAMEQAYIWHILDAVPLLALPTTIGWSEPNVIQDHLSGALLLVFKIAVLAPVVRLGISGYFFVERRLSEGRQRRRREQEQSLTHRYTLRLESREIVTALPLAAAVAGAIYVAWTFLFDPTSWPTRPLDRVIPDTVGAGGFHVGVGWAATLPQWAGAAAIVFLLFWVFAMTFVFEVHAKKWWAVAGACAVYVCVLVLITEAAVALLLALSHVGAIPDASALDDEVRAAYSYFVWPVADAVPGLDIPGTLNWTPVGAFDSTLGGVLQLLYKFTFFLIVFFPLARALRSYSRESHPTPVLQAGLAAAGDFTHAYHEARAALDQAESDVLQARQPRPRRRPSPPLVLGPRYPAARLQDNSRLGTPLLGRSWSSVDTARNRLRALGESLEEVKALFGVSPAADQAEQLLKAGTARLRAIESARPSSFARLQTSVRPVEQVLEETKRLFDAAAAEYTTAAALELHEGAPTL